LSFGKTTGILFGYSTNEKPIPEIMVEDTGFMPSSWSESKVEAFMTHALEIGETVKFSAMSEERSLVAENYGEVGNSRRGVESIGVIHNGRCANTRICDVGKSKCFEKHDLFRY